MSGLDAFTKSVNQLTGASNAIGRLGNSVTGTEKSVAKTVATTHQIFTVENTEEAKLIRDNRAVNGSASQYGSYQTRSDAQYRSDLQQFGQPVPATGDPLQGQQPVGVAANSPVYAQAPQAERVATPSEFLLAVAQATKYPSPENKAFAVEVAAHLPHNAAGQIIIRGDAKVGYEGTALNAKFNGTDNYSSPEAAVDATSKFVAKRMGVSTPLHTFEEAHPVKPVTYNPQGPGAPTVQPAVFHPDAPATTTPAAPAAPAPETHPQPEKKPTPSVVTKPEDHPAPAKPAKEEHHDLTVHEGKGDAAKHYNGVKNVPTTLKQNQVEDMQKLLEGAGKTTGDTAHDGKWGPKTQAAFEEACKEAGVNPQGINFADPKDPKLATLVKHLNEAEAKKHGHTADAGHAAPEHAAPAAPAAPEHTTAIPKDFDFKKASAEANAAAKDAHAAEAITGNPNASFEQASAARPVAAPAQPAEPASPTFASVSGVPFTAPATNTTTLTTDNGITVSGVATIAPAPAASTLTFQQAASPAAPSALFGGDSSFSSYAPAAASFSAPAPAAPAQDAAVQALRETLTSSVKGGQDVQQVASSQNVGSQQQDRSAGIA